MSGVVWPLTEKQSFMKLLNHETRSFQILQNISLIVCIKATKCIVIFRAQNNLNMDGSQCRCVTNIVFIKLYMNTFI